MITGGPTSPIRTTYLFASRELAADGHLVSCIAQPVGPGSPSDHAPIVAIFDV